MRAGARFTKRAAARTWRLQMLELRFRNGELEDALAAARLEQQRQHHAARDAIGRVCISHVGWCTLYVVYVVCVSGP
jgi:hypothetical protein